MIRGSGGGEGVVGGGVVEDGFVGEGVVGDGVVGEGVVGDCVDIWHSKNEFHLEFTYLLLEILIL